LLKAACGEGEILATMVDEKVEKDGTDLEKRVDQALQSWNEGVSLLLESWNEEAVPTNGQRRLATSRVSFKGLELNQRKRKRTQGHASSYSAFVARLETFSPYTWFGKAQRIDKYHCAAHGWCILNKGILACSSCKKKLSFADFEDKVAREGISYLKVIDEFAVALERAHEKHCPFNFSFVSGEIAEALLSRHSRESKCEVIQGVVTPQIGLENNATHNGIQLEKDAALVELAVASQIQQLSECARSQD